jgi:hypothetical protein
MDIIHCMADYLSDGELYFLGRTCKALHRSLQGRTKGPLLEHIIKITRFVLVVQWYEGFEAVIERGKQQPPPLSSDVTWDMFPD